MDQQTVNLLDLIAEGPCYKKGLDEDTNNLIALSEQVRSSLQETMLLIKGHPPEKKTMLFLNKMVLDGFLLYSTLCRNFDSETRLKALHLNKIKAQALDWNDLANGINQQLVLESVESSNENH